MRIRTIRVITPPNGHIAAMMDKNGSMRCGYTASGWDNSDTPSWHDLTPAFGPHSLEASSAGGAARGRGPLPPQCVPLLPMIAAFPGLRRARLSGRGGVKNRDTRHLCVGGIT